VTFDRETPALPGGTVALRVRVTGKGVNQDRAGHVDDLVLTKTN
jgi:hypothetical protein